MKQFIALATAVIVLAACNDEQDKAETHSTLLEAATEVSTDKTDTLCYYRTEGNANQDTTYVQLLVKGDNVTGELNWEPHEKDGRYGSLRGTKSGADINVTWLYTQEGYTDSMPVVMRLQGDNLLQKEGSVDEKTNREYVAENAPFSVKYIRGRCR